MTGAPYSYAQLNIAGVQVIPQSQHLRDNQLYYRYFRYFSHVAFSIFKWKIPDEWDVNFLEQCIFLHGHFAVFSTAEYGTVFNPGCPGGYNLYYRPAFYTVANPLLHGDDLRKANHLVVGKDCALFHLTPDYMGIGDLISQYAEMMATTATTLVRNLTSSQFAVIFPATNKAAAQSYKAMYQEVSRGEPAVYIDKNVLDENGKWEPFNQNVKSNYISDLLLQNLVKLKQEFLTEIGIPVSNTEKKERLLSDEVTRNDSEILSRSDIWLENLQKACRKANAMFNLSLSVERRYTIGDSSVNGTIPVGRNTI